MKFIAEPWDLGSGGYRLGDFPRGWGEWNDRFRDDMRRHSGAASGPADFARRLCASSDVRAPRRAPAESVNLSSHTTASRCAIW